MKKATCKQDLKTDTINLTKYKSYKIDGENYYYIFIIVDGNKNIPFYLQMFTKSIYKNNVLSFKDFFYSEKEERKLKIEKLNKL